MRGDIAGIVPSTRYCNNSKRKNEEEGEDERTQRRVIKARTGLFDNNLNTPA